MAIYKNIHEAMHIARNFQRVNETAKKAGQLLSELRSLSGNHFITPEENKILREADNIIDKIRDISGEWECSKYVNKVLSENESATN